MNKTTRIGLACFLGAFIGALIALDIAQNMENGRYFWPVGAVFGGIVGYLVYDLKGIGQAIGRALQETIAWRPDWIWWRALAILIFYDTLQIATFCYLLLILFSPAY